MHLGSSQLDASVQAATQTMRRQRAASKASGPKAVGPGGIVVDTTQYLEMLHAAEDQVSILSDFDKHPEKYLKSPTPGFRYLWIPLPAPNYPAVNASHAQAMGRVSSGRYIEVYADELLPDSELPYTAGKTTPVSPTHEGTRNTVLVYDLKLVKVSPNSYRDLFQIREAMGFARISSDTEKFYEQMDSQGAFGEITAETTEDVLYRQGEQP